MNRGYRVLWLAVLAVCVACSSVRTDSFGTTYEPLTSGPDVLTQRNDASRTGQNNSETILTPSNVNASNFGLKFTLPVDGFVYAQPLYKGNVTIGGAAHNVVFVATCHDSLYAFDADVGTQLWHTSFINPPSVIPQPAADTGTTDIIPEVGIVSTPVIDPATGILYAVTKTKESAGTFFRLRSVDITTGQETRANAVLTPSVAGMGAGTDHLGHVILDGAQHQQRPGLTLVNGVVYVGFGSSGDNFSWHGWVAGYSASTLAQVSVWNATPDLNNGGVWASGEALAFDSAGNLFFPTGNGDFDGTGAFGDAIIKLSPSAGLTVADYYAPFNQMQLNAIDLDFASAGLVLLPDVAGTAAHPHLLAASGKTGTIYLLDRDNLGKYNPSTTNPDSQIVQYIFNALGTTPINNTAGSLPYVENSYSSPAYWRDATGTDHLYWAGVSDTMKMFNLVNGRLTTTPVSQSTTNFGWPGPSPSISSNGANAGILWAVERNSSSATAAILHAYDATNLSRELYSSAQAPNGRDQMGAPVKFVVPTITNGKVYVGHQTGVAVFGLLGTQTPQAAAPTIAPSAGTYTGSVTVSMTTTTPGASIFYTTDGSTPTASSTKYSSQFTLTQSATVSAVSVATGFLNSPVSASSYVVTTSTPDAGGGGSDSGGGGGGDASGGGGGGGGNVSFVQGTFTNPQAAQASVSVAYPSAQAAGDLNVVVVGWNDSSAQAKTVTDASGNVYALAVGPTVQTGIASQSIFYAKNIRAAVAGNTVTVAFSAAAAFPDIRILEYGGVDTVSPLDVTATAIGNSGASSTPSATTTHASDLLIGANLTQGGTPGPGAGFTSRFITNPDGDIVEDRIVSVTGSYAATTPDPGGAWIIQLAAFKAASVAAPPPPAAPTGLAATAVNSGEIDLAWTNVSTNQTAVHIERSPDGVAFAEVNAVAGNATTYKDTTVAASTKYFFRIRSTNGGGNSPYSPTVNATTPAAPVPTAPTGLSATAIGFSEVDLAWTNTSSTQTGVRIERSTNNVTFTEVAVTAATAATYKDLGLSALTPYFYRIRSTNNAGNSPYTATVSATTPAAPAPPAAPSGLSATPVSSTQIALAWTNNAPSQTGVKVERSTDGGVTFAQIALAVAAATSFTDSNLFSSTSYAYRVRATTGALDSVYSNVVVAVTPAAPPPTTPTGLTAMAASGSQINLSWTNTSTVQSGVAIERSTDNVTFIMIDLVAGSAKGYADSGLNPLTTYRYRVRATGGAGDSPYSNTDFATTTASPPPQSGAIAFVQGNFANPQVSQASVPVAYPAAQIAGHLNVIIVGWNDSSAKVTSVTDTAGNAYSLGVGPTVQLGIASQSIYYAKNIRAAATNSVTVAFSAPAAFADIRLLEYSGVDTVSPLDATASAMGNSGASSSGNLTTTNASDLLVGGNLTQGFTSGPGAGFTSRFITSPDGDIAEDRIVSTAGSYAATTPDPGGAWIIQLVAFKAALGAATPALAFAKDVYPIITTSAGCTGTTGCHSPGHSPSPSGGLDMGTGGAAGAYAALVNRPSPSGAGAVCDTAPLPSGEKLVVPGNSTLSLFYNKLTGAAWVGQSAVLCGGPMPPLQDTPLTSSQMAIIRNWIDQGANP